MNLPYPETQIEPSTKGPCSSLSKTPIPQTLSADYTLHNPCGTADTKSADCLSCDTSGSESTLYEVDLLVGAAAVRQVGRKDR